MPQWIKELLFGLKVAFLIRLSAASFGFAIDTALIALDNSPATIKGLLSVFGTVLCSMVFVWSIKQLWKDFYKPWLLNLRDSSRRIKNSVSELIDEWREDKGFVKQSLREQTLSVRIVFIFVILFFLGTIAGVVVAFVGAVLFFLTGKQALLVTALSGVVFSIFYRSLAFLGQLYLDKKIEHKKTS